MPVYQILGAVLLLAGCLLLIQWRRRRSVAALAAARDEGYAQAAARQASQLAQ